MCFVCLATLGLAFVGIGMFNLETAEGNHLYEEKPKDHSRCSSLKDQTILWIGVAIVCFASIALMTTFCPESSANESKAAQTNCCCCVNQRRIRPDSVQNGDVTEPLLHDGNFVSDAIAPEATVESEHNNSIDEARSADADNPTSGLEYESNDKTSSRLRGTTRLLKLAGKESMYLWLGVVVLLIRLPFSLSIPNFVSAVIGDLIDADFDGARRNVLLLFLIGSVDSVLDFWWYVSLFSLNR